MVMKSNVINNLLNTLPTSNLNYEFEQAVVIYSQTESEKGKFPKLFVQVIDAYGYQREFILNLHCENDAMVWQYTIYHHPGRRFQSEVKEKIAIKFIKRFLYLCQKYPDLLFNKATTTQFARPRNSGFVHFAERLHREEPLDSEML
jgi:hypothetical protein